MIAELRSHIHAAIKASLLTCAELRYDVILGLILKHGLDPENRIEKFDELCHMANQAYLGALSKRRQDPEARNLIDRTLEAVENSVAVDEANGLLNDLFQQCGIVDVVRDCEEVAVAYYASLLYAWTKTTFVTRLIRNEDELEHMVLTGELVSILKEFVATSLTKSRPLNQRPIFYKIRLTSTYRKRALVLAYTSVFKCEYPEMLNGHKTYDLLEDEVRFENHTKIEPNTIEIIFRFNEPPSAETMKRLKEKYASLGHVNFEIRIARQDS